jgi:hypothetical protein
VFCFGYCHYYYIFQSFFFSFFFLFLLNSLSWDCGLRIEHDGKRKIHWLYRTMLVLSEEKVGVCSLLELGFYCCLAAWLQMCQLSSHQGKRDLMIV